MHALEHLSGNNKRIDKVHIFPGSEKYYRQYAGKAVSGPKGWYCPCCNPFGCHPRNMKKKIRRSARRRFRQEIRDLLRSSIEYNCNVLFQ